MTSFSESDDSMAVRLRRLGDRVRAGDRVAKQELQAQLHSHLRRMQRRARRQAAMNDSRLAAWPNGIPAALAADSREITAISARETVCDW